MSVKTIAYLTLALAAIAALAGCSGEPEPIVDVAVLYKGQRVATTCMACHNLERRKNLVGPNLVGILGRQAGTVSGYAYSDAMKKADFRWTRERLSTFLKNTEAMVPGTNMVIQGMTETQIQDLLLYLESWE